MSKNCQRKRTIMVEHPGGTGMVPWEPASPILTRLLISRIPSLPQDFPQTPESGYGEGLQGATRTLTDGKTCANKVSIK